MKKEKRRYIRYRLEDLEGITLFFPSLQISRNLFNLSYKGLGFHPKAGDLEKIPLQKITKAILKLNNQELPIEIEVLYIREDIAGARLTLEKSPDIHKVIRFISPMELGQSLHAIDPKQVRQIDPGRTMTWYVGKNNTELVLWRNPDGSLNEFRMIFLIHLISGKTKVIKTADLNPAELGYLPVYERWPEHATHWHDACNEETKSLALEILEHAKSVNQKDRNEVILGLTRT